MEPERGKRSVGTGSISCALPIVLLLGLTGSATVGPDAEHPEIVRLDGTKIVPVRAVVIRPHVRGRL